MFFFSVSGQDPRTGIQTVSLQGPFPNLSTASDHAERFVKENGVVNYHITYLTPTIKLEVVD